jgi:hypothetical protein
MLEFEHLSANGTLLGVELCGGTCRNDVCRSQFPNNCEIKCETLR